MYDRTPATSRLVLRSADLIHDLHKLGNDVIANDTFLKGATAQCDTLSFTDCDSPTPRAARSCMVSRHTKLTCECTGTPLKRLRLHNTK